MNPKKPRQTSETAEGRKVRACLALVVQNEGGNCRRYRQFIVVTLRTMPNGKDNAV